ncbi:Transposon Tf2-6 polyprotein [Eumeta japonica]|uniref:RNA-directed DNA polymerase n=1 Tax=Eumeta variegata TaxID=151549 RepID=A0A4C1T0D1_EUMVA|nr:Transposon Tf2-6 polyprotein [Eumeta japonica]
MVSGFHQIRIKEDCIHLTGFVTPEDHFEYLKMPYGLANSPIVYQRIINDTLRMHINEGNTLVYVDDVLLLSDSIEEGIRLLRRVLETLTNAGFSINIKKCSFLVTEVEYLGRVIKKGQVRPSPRKIEVLVNTSPPENVKQVRQLLGLAGYFRRYVKDYASKTAPIAHLTRKGSEFVWTPEHELIRQNLIKYLTSEPVLTIFDHNLPTELHTDASSIGYGAVLLQVHPDGRKHAVAYFSKVTQGAESKYHSYELETLAVVKTVQNFRHYLVGLEFTIVTDCNALKATERKKDLLPRVARWWIYLQDFHFTIEYRKGVLMPHADYLSRNPIVAKVNQIQRPRNWAHTAQAADQETQDLLQRLQDGTLDVNRYVARNDLLYYRYVPVGEQPRLLCYIPKGHRLSLLRIFHDEHEHIGADKTADLILKHFWFPGLKQFVSKYVSHCLTCISKKRVPRAPLQNITSWEKPDLPFDTVHVDALGPLPASTEFKYVLIIVDSFSKYCLLYPMSRQDADELKKVITQMISLFGVPKLMITDKGRMFESNSFVRWINDMGCELHSITPEMHHANGQVERYMRTVLNMIRVESTGKLDPGMRGPYKVVNILPSGRYELKLISGDSGKTTQAAAQHMVAWRGEWSPDACAAFFDREYFKFVMQTNSEPTQLSTPAEAELSATSRDDSLIPPTTSEVNQPAVPTPNDTDTSIPPTQSDNDILPPPTYDGAGMSMPLLD